MSVGQPEVSLTRWNNVPTLDVVIEGTIVVPVRLQQPEGVMVAEILELNQAVTAVPEYKTTSQLNLN